METEEICGVTISTLVVAKFATQWSEDNHLSILTERGIYILEVIPSPISSQPCMKFNRSFIYAPNCIPGESIATNASEWVCKREREDLYSLLMESFLTPKMEEMIDTIPIIVNVAWSPKMLLYSNNCLLAILTSAGAVLILHKLFNQWYPAYDITAIRTEAKVEENLPNEYQSIEAYKNRIYELQGTAMVWSEMIDRFAYFTVVYRNGNIVIYKIPKICDIKNIPSAEIALEINLELKSKVTILRWISISASEFLLLIGYFDGRIQSIRIKGVDGDLKVLSIETYCDNVDRIVVSDLLLISKSETEINLLVSKGMILFLIQLTGEGIYKDTQHLRLKAFSISGICNLRNDQVLVLTENGSLWVVSLCGGQLRLNEMKNSLANNPCHYLGLTHSINQAFFVTTTSPSNTYDHLIVKEPSKIYFFNFSLEKYALLTLLKELNNSECGQCWDFFELLRIKALKEPNPTSLFPSNPSNLDSQSVTELRITLWITILDEICSKKQKICDFACLPEDASEIQTIIFILTISNYLERLGKKSVLDNEDETAVNSLRLYLEVYLAGEETGEASFITKSAREIYERTHGLAPKKIETCNICDKNLTDLPWETNKCPDGHILPRCAVTFLQLTNVNCKICPICNRIFHPCLDEEDKCARCLYCDIPLVFDNRLFNLKALREKSLSWPRGDLTTPSGLDSEMDNMD